LAELQRRADKATEAEKRGAQRIQDPIELSIQTQIHTLVLECDRCIAEVRDWGLARWLRSLRVVGSGIKPSTINVRRSLGD